MPKTEPTDEERIELLDRLDTETRTLVDSGAITVWKGRNGKPVLRDGKTGQMLPGTALHENTKHGEGEKASKVSAWKRTNAYRELMERYYTDEKFGEMLEAGLEAAIGNAVRKEVTCPECAHGFTETMYRRPDATIFFKTMEQLMGRAEETRQINVNTEHLYRLLDERTDVREIQVFTVTPEEEEERRLLLDAEEEGLIVSDSG